MALAPRPFFGGLDQNGFDSWLNGKVDGVLVLYTMNIGYV